MDKNSLTLLKYRRKLVWLAALLVSLLLFLPAACSWSHLPAESASSQTQPLTSLASQGQAAVTPAPSLGANPESSSSQTSSSSDILPHGKLAGAQSPVICESTAGAGPTGEISPSSEIVTSEPAKICVTTTKATTKKVTTSKTTTVKTTQAGTYRTTTAATSTAKTEPAPTSSTSQDPVQAMFSATNALRQKNGLAPLKNGSQAMANAAAERARDLAVSFSHNRPDGSSFSTALKSCGVSYTCAAENIANFPATSQVSQVLTAWEGSSGHLANMLRTDMTCLSIGFYSHNGRHYWVQIFTNS
jgi:uncharacterized protein YkwD